MSTQLTPKSTAISIAAAQNVQINLLDISETLQKQEKALTDLSASPILDETQLQHIQGIVWNVGERLTVLQRTGLASPAPLAGLREIQQDLMVRVSTADQRISILTRALRDQARAFTHLEVSKIPLAGTQLKKMRDQLVQIGEELTALRWVFLNVNGGEPLERAFAQLDELSDSQKLQIGRVQACLDTLSQTACFSVVGRNNLRLPATVHSKIGSFVGPHFRVGNTFCRDDIQNPPPPQRSSSLNSFESAVYAEDFDRDNCVQVFKALDSIEHMLMSHFLWVAMGKDDPTWFKANQQIESSTKTEMVEAVIQSIAARKVEKFHVATRGIDLSNCGDDERIASLTQIRKAHWQSMTRGNRKASGEQAQTAIRTAIWILRGLTNLEGNATSQPPSAAAFCQIMGTFDRVVHIACHRLTKNHLMLLESQKDRDAILRFAKAYQLGGNTVLGLQEAFLKLKVQSADAAKLLAFAVANGFNQENGEKFILSVNDQDVARIYEIAFRISAFDNGEDRTGPFFHNVDSDLNSPISPQFSPQTGFDEFSLNLHPSYFPQDEPSP